ncbi:MAG: hypothetical protein AB1742_04180 [bacterium]
MVITRKKLEGLIADLDKLFPEPDPNAKIEDVIGCFKDIFPKDKSSVELIREERAKMFGLDPNVPND